MQDRSFVTDNALSRARLEALLDRLSDDDLRRPLDGGWTVAAALAHLAFWEQRALVLLQRWREAPVASSAADVDAINDALRPQWLALPPRAVTEHLLAVCRAVDRALEAAPTGTIEAIRTGLGSIDLVRAEHREEHFDEIERVLAASGHGALANSWPAA